MFAFQPEPCYSHSVVTLLKQKLTSLYIRYFIEVLEESKTIFQLSVALRSIMANRLDPLNSFARLSQKCYVRSTRSEHGSRSECSTCSGRSARSSSVTTTIITAKRESFEKIPTYLPYLSFLLLNVTVVCSDCITCTSSATTKIITVKRDRFSVNTCHI